MMIPCESSNYLRRAALAFLVFVVASVGINHVIDQQNKITALEARQVELLDVIDELAEQQY